MAFTPGFTLPPVGSSGAPIFEPGIFTGSAGTRSISLLTPNLGDRTTWYQKSVQVTGETLTNLGDDLTFQSANPWWIDIKNGKLTYTYNQIPARDGTWKGTSNWLASVLVDGAPVTSGYTINFATGTVTFDTSQAGKTVTANYWTNNNVQQPSEWLFAPISGYKYIIHCVELQYSINIPANFDTIRFEVWAGAPVAQYTGCVATGTTVPANGAISAPGIKPTLTTVTTSFVQPNAMSTVTVSVASTVGMAANMPLYVAGGGFYVVGAVVNSTTLILVNLGYGSFSDSVYAMGFGQFRADYRNVWDIVNVTNNQNSTVIPAHGGMTQDLFIAPFNYTQATVLDSAQSVVLRICLLTDTPIPDVDIATATFYLQLGTDAAL